MSAQTGACTLTVLERMQVSSLGDVLDVETTCYEFPWTRGNFVDSLSAGYLARCLWTPERALVGYSMAMPGVEEMHLLNLTVAPFAQGRGHALTLMLRLVVDCRERAADTLWLEVRPSNLRARMLYERFGFSVVGSRRGYYPAAQGQREDAIVMSLDTRRGIDGLD